MRFLWVLVPVIAAVLWWLLSSSPRASLSDDTSGGIPNSSLIELCRERLTYEIGTGFSLPTSEEINGQITSSSEEKRWDGWVQTPNGRLEFSCQFTPASGAVVLEVIR
jgi:hypothetical protein